MGAVNPASVIQFLKCVSKVSKRITETAAPESKRKVIGEGPIDPGIRKVLLMLQHSLLFCPCGWWVTDDGASWHPPVKLAPCSLKDSVGTGDQMLRNCSMGPPGDFCDIFVGLCHSLCCPLVGRVKSGLFVSSALLPLVILVIW